MRKEISEGHTDTSHPSWIRTEHFLSTEELFNFCIEELKTGDYDAAILTAAMADFKPSSYSKNKIRSDDKVTLELTPTQKLSDAVKKIAPQTMLILFKAEYNVSRDELIQISKDKQERAECEYIIANDVSASDAGFQVDTNRILIISKNNDQIKEFFDSKTNLAIKIVEHLLL